MQITNFKEMYIAELQELVSMEKQLTAALARMAEIASHPALKSALTRHFRETEAQRMRLQSILQVHGASTDDHTDQAMAALIQETQKMLGLVKGKDLCDAALIASLQKLEHYEMAAYGTAVALAGELEMRKDQAILRQNLEEEKETDLLLTRLATGEVNHDALAA